jgi:hypothetical protein
LPQGRRVERGLPNTASGVTRGVSTKNPAVLKARQKNSLSRPAKGGKIPLALSSMRVAVLMREATRKGGSRCRRWCAPPPGDR